MSTHQPIRHILVAHDFEPDADAALDYALALAKPLGARVTIIHTFEAPPVGAPEVLVVLPEWIAQVSQAARGSLDRILERASGKEVPVDSELRQGSPWHEVGAFAKERQVDLIVVGTHGRKGLPRALLGSVSEKIVRTAPCPVLVVRS
jgi:nucleotide-binding universal stress UspA family protein